MLDHMRHEKSTPQSTMEPHVLTSLSEDHGDYATLLPNWWQFISHTPKASKKATIKYYNNILYIVSYGILCHFGKFSNDIPYE